MDRRTENFHVAGTSYRQDAIMTLAKEDSDYELSKKDLIDEGREDERVYKYYFNPKHTELVPEPDNPHDPNAIKVMADGVHIGYVKAGSCSHVKNLLASGKVSSYGVDIEGGPYKRVYENDDGDYQIEKNETDFFATLMITVQDDLAEPIDAVPKPSQQSKPGEGKKYNATLIIASIISSILSLLISPVFLIVAVICIILAFKLRK